LRRRPHGPLPLSVPDPNAFADAVLGNAFPNLVDDPGAVAVRHDESRLNGTAAGPGLGVRRIHAGRMEPDSYLAGARRGIGQFPDLQDLLCFTVLGIPGCAHMSPPHELPCL